MCVLKIYLSVLDFSHCMDFKSYGFECILSKRKIKNKIKINCVIESSEEGDLLNEIFYFYLTCHIKWHTCVLMTTTITICYCYCFTECHYGASKQKKNLIHSIDDEWDLNLNGMKRKAHEK